MDLSSSSSFEMWTFSNSLPISIQINAIWQNTYMFWNGALDCGLTKISSILPVFVLLCFCKTNSTRIYVNGIKITLSIEWSLPVLFKLFLVWWRNCLSNLTKKNPHRFMAVSTSLLRVFAVPHCIPTIAWPWTQPEWVTFERCYSSEECGPLTWSREDDWLGGGLKRYITTASQRQPFCKLPNRSTAPWQPHQNVMMPVDYCNVFIITKIAEKQTKAYYYVCCTCHCFKTQQTWKNADFCTRMFNTYKANAD